MMTYNLFYEYDTQLLPVCNDTQNLNETESDTFLNQVVLKPKRHTLQTGPDYDRT